MGTNVEALVRRNQKFSSLKRRCLSGTVFKWNRILLTTVDVPVCTIGMWKMVNDVLNFKVILKGNIDSEGKGSTPDPHRLRKRPGLNYRYPEYETVA